MADTIATRQPSSSPERTGEQTALGAVNIVFGLMGVVLSILMVLFSGSVQAHLFESAQPPGMLITRMPAGNPVSMVIECGLALAWAGLVVAGLGMLQLAPWSRAAGALAGAALLTVCGLKLVDSGVSFMTLGFAGYAVLLVLASLRVDWSGACAHAATSSPARAARDDGDVSHKAA